MDTSFTRNGLDAETSFSLYSRFRSTLNTGLKVGLGIHVYFAVLFYFHHVPVLSLFNVGSVLLYISCLIFLEKGKDRLVIFLAWLEILGHAAICSVVLGLDSGFHYYIIALLPLIFVNTSRSTVSKLTVSCILGLIYVGLHYTMRSMPPLSVIKPHSLAIMYYGNIVACMAIMGFISHIYSQSVFHGENELKKINQSLEQALKEVKTLQGILPICSFCKKIRDDHGYWEQVEVYVGEHSQADFSHSICPDCLKKNYPEYNEEENYAGNQG
ncbi:MAG: hypothetical protein KKF30_00210 [Proteobacteria bacterium]|nr:hypothetical protein [Pseudomonadota bacterium]MBU4471057.1 hypothetical protein [Pseudomonadota bacterium]MCG2753657.1 hypothetical protein [Desulfobacteraceae bacterium]